MKSLGSNEIAGAMFVGFALLIIVGFALAGYSSQRKELEDRVEGAQRIIEIFEEREVVHLNTIRLLTTELEETSKVNRALVRGLERDIEFLVKLLPLIEGIGPDPSE